MAKAKTSQTNKAKAAAGRDTLAKVRAHLADVETRLKAADRASHKSIGQLSAAHDLLAKKLTASKSGGKAVKDLRAHVDELSAHLNTQMKTARREIKRDLAASLGDIKSGAGHVDHVREGLARATARLTTAERRQAESVQKINEQIIRLATAIDNRVSGEARERAALEARQNTRIGQLEIDTAEKIRAVEDNSASAIRKIGEQINGLSGQLSKTAENAQRQMEGRIYEAALDSQHEIESLKSDVHERIDAVSRTQPDLGPVSRSVAAMAARLDALEARLSSASLQSIKAVDGDGPPPFVPPISQPEVNAQLPNKLEDTHFVDDPFAPPAAATTRTPIHGVTDRPAPAESVPAQSATAHPSGAVEFDPSAYPQVDYQMEPAPQSTAPQTPTMSPAQSQMALHDYDAPAHDPLDYQEPSTWQAEASKALAGDMLPAPGDLFRGKSVCAAQ